MINVIGVGIIGCGAIATTHAQAIEKQEELKLVACSDSDDINGRLFAKTHSCQLYQEYHALLKDRLVDLVVICRPHYLHKEMTIAALLADKHVLCEKPMATTMEDAWEIYEQVQKSQKSYQVCYQNRYNASYVWMKELLTERPEQLGKLRGVKCEVTWQRDASYYVSEWKGTWAKEGGGVLINQAIHTLDAVTWLIGKPEKIQGRIMTSLLDGAIEVEDTAMATAAYRDNTPFVIHATNNYSNNPTPKITFDYDHALIELTSEQVWVNGEKQINNKEHHFEPLKDYWGTGHQSVYQALVHKINGLSDVRISYLAGLDALDSLEIVLGIYKSDKQDQWIKLTEKKSELFAR